MRHWTRRLVLLLTLVGAVLFACAGVVLAQPNQPASSQQSEVVPDQYIVVLKDSVPKTRPEEKAEEAKRDGARIGHVYTEALKGYSATISAGKLAKLKEDPDVEYVAQDRKVQAFAQTRPTGIDRIDAEWNSTTTSPDYGANGMPGVAILDTGVDANHPDLNVARDSAGAVDGGKCNGTSTNDGHGHGTHVAGTIAAKDDANGVVGVAPGAKVYPVKVLDDSGSGTTSTVVCGIDWVTANAAAKGIKVANMSLGGSGSDDGNCGNSNGDPEHKAICNSTAAGVTYAVAAGNSNVDLKGFVPAAYNEVLAVTALADFNGQPGGGAAATCRSDVDDTPADFSNWTTSGSSDASHTIDAPGVCIYSTYKGSSYATMSGTSMASPHVAGSALTCLANRWCTDTNGDSKISPDEIATKLRTDAAAQPASYGYTYTGSNYYDKLEYAGDYRTTNSSAPAAPTISLAAASDTGSSNTDRLTNDNTPTFEGTAGANNTVEIFADGGTTPVCTTTADASGKYTEASLNSCTVTTTLVDKITPYSFTAKATDTASNTSSSSAALSVTIDTAAPKVPDSSLSPANNDTAVALNTSVSATFDEAMDSATVTGSTFYLFDNADPTKTPITATVTYDAAARKATLTPSTDLKANTTYTATVTTGVKDKAGNPLAADKVWSFTTASAPVLAAPSNLTATANGSRKNPAITLNWQDKSNNETGFKVERSTDNASWSQVAAPAANATSYTDGGLSPGTTYYYRVKATNGAVDSDPSNTASAKTK